MRPEIICLTPVRNEAWILDRFLKAASIWADHIIISDQMSTDGSRDIALKYPKVILIENKVQKDFSEYELRKPLIEEARKIKGPRLLISIDADEVFTPNFDCPEWRTIRELPPGTIIKFPWINIAPDFNSYWSTGSNIPVGYMDDGAEFKSGLIHACRLFDPDKNTKYILKTTKIKILHLQYSDWNRMDSKHRWYQCFEKINYPGKSAVDIFRQYHHMYSLSEDQFLKVPSEWTDGYEKLDIDLTSVFLENKLFWDEKILGYFDQYGTEYFRKISIWDVNWSAKAKLYNKINPEIYKDPRSKSDKMIQSWLMKTQNKLHIRKYRRIDRLIKMILKY